MALFGTSPERYAVEENLRHSSRGGSHTLGEGGLEEGCDVCAHEIDSTSRLQFSKPAGRCCESRLGDRGFQYLHREMHLQAAL